MITPLFDRVLIEKVNEQNKSQLLITSNQPDNIGIVVAVGDVEKVNVGNKVMFNKYATTTIHADDKEYLLIKEIDILAIIQGENHE